MKEEYKKQAEERAMELRPGSFSSTGKNYAAKRDREWFVKGCLDTIEQSGLEELKEQIAKLREDNKQVLLKYHTYLIGQGMKIDIALDEVYVDEFLEELNQTS